ncbi:hypothetical protein PoB_006619500 [Plakobranchus ocellatus]|uniref:Uncharacterized protein n=1 Tax=Plakobranchus ocellatus TaxID=259542 RepID=A0AAV4D6S7_9GAST|nr:hypothetical protein PoB_006619500 [Plakobranchus ocellatus]
MDYVTFELELSGNSTLYTYNISHGPEFRRQNLKYGNATIFGDELICRPFTVPEKGFCTKKNKQTSGCSCKTVGPQVYRVKVTYTVTNVNESRGRIQLVWPSIYKDIQRFYYLPEIRAHQPSMTIVKIVSSFLCTDRYLVVGLDSVTFELELSGNFSIYSYKQFHWPEFKLQKWTKGNAKLTSDKLVCSPFTRPENGFCVKSDICAPFTTPENGFCVKRDDGCSCEEIRPQVYRVGVTYTVESIVESQGRLSLIWLSKNNHMEAYANLPAIKEHRPSLKILQRVASHQCFHDYLTVGFGYVTFELELYGNSLYSYQHIQWPDFRLQKWTDGPDIFTDNQLVCSPFTTPEKGFCVKGDFCSCEEVSPQVYRVKIVYRPKGLDESRGRLSLIWPTKAGNIMEHFYLPEVKDPRPKLTIEKDESSFMCNDAYLVVGKDFITFEVVVSGNNSKYSLEKYNWPVFYVEIVDRENKTIVKHYKPICAPFTTPENGFCVKRDGCSCEKIYSRKYRVKVTYTVESINESGGRISLIWPSQDHYLKRYMNIPEVKDSCPE